MSALLHSTKNISKQNAVHHPRMLYHHQHRAFLNLQLGRRIRNYMKNSDERSNQKAWYGEARRFLEYEEYTLYSFDAHLRTTVDSYDKAGPGRRSFRRMMKYFNKDADDHQKKMVDESRQLLHILDTFPSAAFEDPDKYFKGLNKSKLALETKLQTSDLQGILDKYDNQRTTHKLLKEQVSKGKDLPTSAQEMQDELAKPGHVVPTMRKNQAFGASNPNKENPIFDKYIMEWNHKCWISPYRLRQGVSWKKGWKQKDWRQYQPKWESKENLDFTVDEYKQGAVKKLYPEDYKRQELLRSHKPTWMKKYAWKQWCDRRIEMKNDHKNGIGDHMDIYNYDRFRSVHDKTDMRTRKTKAPRYGGHKRGFLN